MSQASTVQQATEQRHARRNVRISMTINVSSSCVGASGDPLSSLPSHLLTHQLSYHIITLIVARLLCRKHGQAQLMAFVHNLSWFMNVFLFVLVSSIG